MSLTLGDNFSYGGAKPLDARLTYNTLAKMKAVADSTMYDGCMAYCSESDKTYQWKSTNTVDETLGRWREFSSGGGSTGGGHTIEDSEGTDLTQRETLQFGEGFKVEDDDTNEKTVISPDIMQSGDMDDVITPLPSVQTRYHKYSTTEQVVGEWIDGKPIYEKTINTGAFPSNSEKDVAHGISNIENIITYFGFAKRNDNVFSNIPISSNTSSALIQTDCNLTNIRLITGYGGASVYIDSYITLQYTKTTDTSNT